MFKQTCAVLENKKVAPGHWVIQLFSRAIAKTARELRPEDGCVTRQEVAKAILKSKAFTQDNLDLLTVMVGEAVKHGEVPGWTSRRGPGGGLHPVGSEA